MPTAADAGVFIRWTRMEVTPNPETGHYYVLTDAIVSVAGERVETFITSVSMASADIIDDRDNALEDKRQTFVSA